MKQTHDTAGAAATNAPTNTPEERQTEKLFTCPRCGRTGFYARGLLAHVCRGTNFLDTRRRLTSGELAAVGLEARRAAS